MLNKLFRTFVVECCRLARETVSIHKQVQAGVGYTLL